MIAIVGVDVLFYAYHRIAHRVRLIWATHQAHHSSRYFNFATALRQKWNNSGELILWMPLLLLGVPPWMVFTSFSISLVYQFWIHTERIGTLPGRSNSSSTPLAPPCTTGWIREYLDKNYGGILIIWDRMFGTFQFETFPSALRTDQAGQHLQHLVAGNPRVRGDRLGCPLRQGWRNKLGYIFGPPVGNRPSRSLRQARQAEIMDVSETRLPGVGLRYELRTATASGSP